MHTHACTGPCRGGVDGRVVKVLDSRPRDHGFEFEMGARFVPQMCLEVIVNMQLLACREPHKINQV